MEHIVQAGRFKAECLKLMDEVKNSKNPIIITKHNVPIVKIVPLEEESMVLFGKMKGTAHEKGNIVESTGEVWNADL